MENTYFSALAFSWAALGIGSRVAMFAMKDRWATWELEDAYASKRPAWVAAVAICGFALIGWTWYMVFTADVAYAWVLASLVSLTGIKLSALLFDYARFRGFVAEALGDTSKMLRINVGVLLLSGVLIWMGIALY